MILISLRASRTSSKVSLFIKDCHKLAITFHSSRSIINGMNSMIIMLKKLASSKWRSQDMAKLIIFLTKMLIFSFTSKKNTLMKILMKSYMKV